MRKLLLGLAATLSFGSAANAATIVNGSFEMSEEDPGSFTTLNNGSLAITGWKVGGTSIDYIGNYWQAQGGSKRSIDLAGTGNGSISQVIATIVGQVYKVTFWVARNPDDGITPRTGFVDVGGTPTAISFGNSGSTKGNMGWEQRDFTFQASSPSTTLTFSSDPATSEGNWGMALDNVSIGAVPEPGTWLMMLFGFGLIGFSMRRRQKNLVRYSFA